MLDIAIRRRMPAEELGLSRCEAEMLGLLLSEDRWWKTRELWCSMTTDAGPEIIKVFAFRLRTKIGRVNENPVEGVKGRGYRLTQAARTRLLNWSSVQRNPATPAARAA
jgi:DNA-binding response OmpR family regulator